MYDPLLLKKCQGLEILNRAAYKPVKSSRWCQLSFSPNPKRDLKKNKNKNKTKQRKRSPQISQGVDCLHT